MEHGRNVKESIFKSCLLKPALFLQKMIIHVNYLTFTVTHDYDW